MLYRITSKTEKGWGSAAMPHWVALWSFLALLYLNIFTLFIISNHVLDLKIISLTKFHAIALGTFIFVALYFSFLKAEKYKTIAKKFDEKIKKKKLIMYTAVWSYIILSFVLFYYILFAFSPVDRV